MPTTTHDLRRFGWTLGAAFAILGAVLWGWRRHAGPGQAFVAGGLALLLAGAVAPRALGPVERGWMALARAMSVVTTPVFMGVVYFLVLTPVGLLRRALAGRVLVHGASPRTAWQPATTSSSMLRQF